MNSSVVLSAAFMLDLLFADPQVWWHPVRIFGNIAVGFECFLRKVNLSLKTLGILYCAILVFVNVVAVYGVSTLLSNYSVGAQVVFASVVVYFSISVRDLLRHSHNVVKALNCGDISSARKAVSFMVSRNADLLDEDGVVRSTIESVAENSIDGVVSALFWSFVGGIVGGVEGACAFAWGFRCSNTLDAMVGYKNEKYIDFGWAAAKFDDVLNFFPARLSLLFSVMAAALMRYDWRSAFRIGLRDCKKHSSPNSGFGESAFAGALGVRLGGPTYYKEGRKDSPYIGDDINPLNAESISDANKIALVLSFFSWVIFSLLLIFYWRVLHV